MVVPGEDKARDGIKEAADAAGKTVVAAALAGAVVTGAAAVTPDQINLPEPAPIVQMVDQPVQSPDQTVDDHADKQSQNGKRIWQILKFILLALFLVAGVLFGMLSGCAGCTGQVVAPLLQDSSSSSAAVEISSASSTSAASEAQSASSIAVASSAAA